MKRTLLIIATAWVSAALSNTPEGAKPTTSHGIPEAVLKKTGGIIEKRGQGKIVIINCQDLISETLVAERAARLGRLLKCDFEVRKGPWNPSVRRPDDANFAIYVVRDPGLPMSLVAVESGWGMLNTDGLDTGNRFSKQLTRVFALTVGAMCSRNVHSPMQPVTKAGQLDHVMSDDIMRDMIDSIRINMKARGMTPTRIASYKKACQEGWAPAPTNDVQKAIWEKVHAIPDKPITIEFDKKTGK